MKTTRPAGLLCVAIALGLMATLGGCSDDITGRSVRWDPTPEMETMGRTGDQHDTEVRRSLNETGRQIWDDWDNFWFLDEPIRLTQWPIP